MRRIVYAFAGLLVLGVAAAAQTQFRTPGQTDASLDVTGCLNASGQAVPCGTTSNPMVVTATASSGPLSLAPIRGVPVTSATTSIGTTAVQVMAANASRSYLFVQNPSMVDGATPNTAHVWCNAGGSTAVAGSPSTHLPPGASMSMGLAPGFVTTTAVSCIASAAGTPIVARSFP